MPLLEKVKFAKLKSIKIIGETWINSGTKSIIEIYV
jgi:hypothetical protein